MTAHQCPVCRADLPASITNHDSANHPNATPPPKNCPVCGWYLEPLSIPMTNAMAQFLSCREEIQLTWARDMWQKVQLQAELGDIHRDIFLMIRQLRRGHKERSELYAQLLHLRDWVDRHPELLESPQDALPQDDDDTNSQKVAIAPPDNTPSNNQNQTHQNQTAPPPLSPPPISSNATAAAQNAALTAQNAALIGAVQELQEQVHQQWVFLQDHVLFPEAPLVSPTPAPADPIAKNGQGPPPPQPVPTSQDTPAVPTDDRLDPLDIFEFDTASLKIPTTIAPSPTPENNSDSGAPETPENNSDSGTPETAEAAKRNVNYRKLHKLLAAGEWYEADRETTRLMLKVAGRSATSWLRIEDIENFPAEDLQAIDRLWVAYSQDHFGFSIQKQLWLDINDGSTSQVEAWCQFGDSLGWLSKKNLGTGLKAPTGHLPSCSSVGVWWSSGLFLQVLESCQL